MEKKIILLFIAFLLSTGKYDKELINNSNTIIIQPEIKKERRVIFPKVVNVIAKYEGFSIRPIKYKNRWYVGFGQAMNHKSIPLTKFQVDSLMKTRYRRLSRRSAKTKINKILINHRNYFNSLLPKYDKSFIELLSVISYQYGTRKIGESRLFSLIKNKATQKEILYEYLKFIYHEGKFHQGYLNRRNEEIKAIGYPKP